MNDFTAFFDAEDVVNFGQVAAFPSAHPVTPGHTLIVPTKRRVDYFDLTREEADEIWAASRFVRNELLVTYRDITGFNLGWNVGASAGQTVLWAHLHIIPRRDGDVDDPSGGIRGVIPNRRRY